MVTTATKPRKATKPLWIKTINPRTWHVECKSRQHFYHTVVRSLSTSNLVCDLACWEYRKAYTCPHIDRVHEELNPSPVITSLTPFELWQGDEYSTLEAGDGPVFGDSCCYDTRDVPGDPDCSCVCHSMTFVEPWNVEDGALPTVPQCRWCNDTGYLLSFDAQANVTTWRECPDCSRRAFELRQSTIPTPPPVKRTLEDLFIDA